MEMTLDDELDVLRRVPFFEGMDSARLKLLAFASDRVIFKKGQEIFSEYEKGNSAFVILRGEADVSKRSEEGTVSVVKIQSGSIVGEEALLHTELRASTVIAGDTVDALLIKKDSFQNLMASCPDIKSDVLKFMRQSLLR